MLVLGTDDRPSTEAQTVELIADRIVAALRDDLEAITAELSAAGVSGEQLNVAQVAQLLRVARSTVYAHWREWGGYKLGGGDKAPIRFDRAALPITKAPRRPREPLAAERQPSPVKRARRRRDVLVGTPRLVDPPNTAD